MEARSVTSKDQVTVPKEVRRGLGIRQGSHIEFVPPDGHALLRVSSSPAVSVGSDFGMLKNRRKKKLGLKPAVVVPA